MKFLRFENIGELLVFERIRPRLRSYLLKAGISRVPYKLYGQFFYVTVFLSLLIYFLFVYNVVSYSVIALVVWSILSLILIDVLLVFLFMIILRTYYSTKIYNRTKKIEEVLPMFLEGVRINLEAGMTFDEALLASIEPEFSILKDEIKIVAQKAMTGVDTEEALHEFAIKYDSLLLKEVVDLLGVGLRGGANMEDVLKKLIDSIKLNNYLKKTVVNSVMGYIIFITIIAVLISPILFALSYNLLVIFEGFGAKLGTAATEYLSIGFSTLVHREDFITFSRFSISTIALFASLIIINLRKGNIKGGWKYIPIYVGIALGIYEIVFRLLIFAFAKVF